MRGIDLPGPACIIEVLFRYNLALVSLRVLSRCQAPSGKRPEPRARDPVVAEREWRESEESDTGKRARVSERAARG